MEGREGGRYGGKRRRKIWREEKEEDMEGREGGRYGGRRNEGRERGRYYGGEE